MPTLAHADLQPFQNSGISGRLTFSQSDDGDTLTVSGNASGFGLGAVYVSLVYGLGSTAIGEGQGPPCADDRSFNIEPPIIVSNKPGDVTFSPVATVRMLVGVWGGILGVPILGSNRSLSVTKPTASPTGVRLEQIRTVSIRQATLPDITNLNILKDIRPQVFQLRACGLIVPGA
ncbi:MAG: hypothetical protein ACRDSR_19455 [Pseudonocardiaceae bacterium]